MASSAYNPSFSRERLMVVPLTPGATPFQFSGAGSFIETLAVFSPDGKYVAYQSNVTGRTEIYVRAFQPDAGVQSSARWMVSTQGGRSPSWSRDGHKLYWVAARGPEFFEATIETSPTFRAGIPVKLSEIPTAVAGETLVTRRGRMLLKTLLDRSTSEPLNVLVNWRSALRFR
jgi:serine/threonine-protein kinase